MVEICEQIELSEGDLVLTFNKTIDLLRQVREMLTDVLPEHPLRFALRDAERLIRRDIVEQSLTLGFAPLQLDEVAPEEVAEEPPRPFDRLGRTYFRPLRARWDNVSTSSIDCHRRESDMSDQDYQSTVGSEVYSSDGANVGSVAEIVTDDRRRRVPQRASQRIVRYRRRVLSGAGRCDYQRRGRQGDGQ